MLKQIVFSFLLIAPVMTVQAICVGNNYEMGVPVAQVTPPTVTLTHDNNGVQLDKGQQVMLTATATVDTGGQPYYYWCAEYGHFEVLPDNPEHIIYVASEQLSNNSWVQVSVQVGDSLGYVDGDSLFFRIGDPLLARLAYLKATAADEGVHLEWQTLTEKNNAGFVLWRGQPKGKTCSHHQADYNEVVRLSFAAGQGDKLQGALYKRQDNTVAPETTYCYLLEDVNLNGESTFHWRSIASVITP